MLICANCKEIIKQNKREKLKDLQNLLQIRNGISVREHHPQILKAAKKQWNKLIERKIKFQTDSKKLIRAPGNY